MNMLLALLQTLLFSVHIFASAILQKLRTHLFDALNRKPEEEKKKKKNKLNISKVCKRLIFVYKCMSQRGSCWIIDTIPTQLLSRHYVVPVTHLNLARRSEFCWSFFSWDVFRHCRCHAKQNKKKTQAIPWLIGNFNKITCYIFCINFFFFRTNSRSKNEPQSNVTIFMLIYSLRVHQTDSANWIVV